MIRRGTPQMPPASHGLVAAIPSSRLTIIGSLAMVPAPPRGHLTCARTTLSNILAILHFPCAIITDTKPRLVSDRRKAMRHINRFLKTYFTLAISLLFAGQQAWAQQLIATIDLPQAPGILPVSRRLP